MCSLGITRNNAPQQRAFLKLLIRNWRGGGKKEKERKTVEDKI